MDLEPNLSPLVVGGDIEADRRAQNRIMVANGECCRKRYANLSERIKAGKARASEKRKAEALR